MTSFTAAGAQPAQKPKLLDRLYTHVLQRGAGGVKSPLDLV